MFLWMIACDAYETRQVIGQFIDVLSEIKESVENYETPEIEPPLCLTAPFYENDLMRQTAIVQQQFAALSIQCKKLIDFFTETDEGHPHFVLLQNIFHNLEIRTACKECEFLAYEIVQIMSFYGPALCMMARLDFFCFTTRDGKRVEISLSSEDQIILAHFSRSEVGDTENLREDITAMCTLVYDNVDGLLGIIARIKECAQNVEVFPPEENLAMFNGVLQRLYEKAVPGGVLVTPPELDRHTTFLGKIDYIAELLREKKQKLMDFVEQKERYFFDSQQAL